MVVSDINKNRNVKSILILISRSWGEIDWILPVCSYIKNHYPNIKMHVLFNAIESREIIKGNEFLYKVLLENVSGVYQFKDFFPNFFQRLLENIILVINHKNCPRSFKVLFELYFFTFLKIILCKKIVISFKPDVILKDTSADTYARKRIINYIKKKGGREIMFPHASELYLNPDVIDKRSDLFADDILCNTESMKKLFYGGNSYYDNNIHVVGVPRYDRWWIFYLIDYWEKNYADRIYNDPKLTKILLYSYGVHPKVYDFQTAELIFHEIVKYIFSLNESFLIIKPHPRQDIKKLYKNLENYDKNRWLIDQSQAICLSSIADIIISMGRHSVIYDSLVAGKPTIQYFKDINEKTHLDLYGNAGIAPTARCISELDDWIKKLNSKKESEIFIRNFNKIYLQSEKDATLRAVNVILKDNS